MLTNGFFKNKNRLKIIQKAIMAGIGVTTSKELIKKAAIGLYDDIQKIVKDLLGELEEQGKLKTKETKILITELQKKSEIEKIKIYNKLQKDSKNLFKTAKDIILAPVAIAKEISELSGSRNLKNSKKSKSVKKKKSSTKRRK